MAHLPVIPVNKMSLSATFWQGDITWAQTLEKTYTPYSRCLTEESAYLFKASLLYAIALPVLLGKSSLSFLKAYARRETDPTQKEHFQKNLCQLGFTLKRMTVCSSKAIGKALFCPMDLFTTLGNYLYRKTRSNETEDWNAVAILLINVQNDFMDEADGLDRTLKGAKTSFEKGAASIDGATNILSPLDELTQKADYPIPILNVLTEHPEEHLQFQENHKREDHTAAQEGDEARLLFKSSSERTSFPVCPSYAVEGTEGAEPIYSKGCDAHIKIGLLLHVPAEGGFYTNTLTSRVDTTMKRVLKCLGVQPNRDTLLIGGCGKSVLETARQGLKEGFRVVLIEDAIALDNKEEELNQLEQGTASYWDHQGTSPILLRLSSQNILERIPHIPQKPEGE